MKRSTEAVVSSIITAKAKVIRVAPHSTAVDPRILKKAGVIGLFDDKAWS
jgi:hypothetical protein